MGSCCRVSGVLPPKKKGKGVESTLHLIPAHDHSRSYGPILAASQPRNASVAS